MRIDLILVGDGNDLAKTESGIRDGCVLMRFPWFQYACGCACWDAYPIIRECSQRDEDKDGSDRRDAETFVTHDPVLALKRMYRSESKEQERTQNVDQLKGRKATIDESPDIDQKKGLLVVYISIQQDDTETTQGRRSTDSDPS